MPKNLSDTVHSFGINFTCLPTPKTAYTLTRLSTFALPDNSKCYWLLKHISCNGKLQLTILKNYIFRAFSNRKHKYKWSKYIAKLIIYINQYMYTLFKLFI